MLKIGQKIQDFTLKGDHGQDITLSSFIGKKVILYFYPKDDTPGCTAQACAIRDAYEDFEALGIVVIGISKDSVKKHQKFKEKYQLPFLLLSDEELQVVQYFDVWKEKKLYGRKYMGIMRTTFVLNENHELTHIFENVDPANHASELLSFFSK